MIPFDENYVPYGMSTADKIFLGLLFSGLQGTVVHAWITGPPPQMSPWLFYPITSFFSAFFLLVDGLAVCIWRDQGDVVNKPGEEGKEWVWLGDNETGGMRQVDRLDAKNHQYRVETENDAFMREAEREVEEFLADKSL